MRLDIVDPFDRQAGELVQQEPIELPGHDELDGVCAWAPALEISLPVRVLAKSPVGRDDPPKAMQESIETLLLVLRAHLLARVHDPAVRRHGPDRESVGVVGVECGPPEQRLPAQHGEDDGDVHPFIAPEDIRGEVHRGG
ncbi:hypothetical protein DSL72_008079 [Monilinia vaccinii-corymbosi]|uniref:Uncharacterized protein n=1 Tax=Monilinia vaccinii-corymbosi TaxID=61207 RepID=A0A8A3PIV0_9HELO|nr:hypothetical protein DSL72_008079 [Monilinia vaccinii-corymbosi]